jgi:hypothetical protein
LTESISGRGHCEVDRDAGKFQVTSKHESESQAQRDCRKTPGSKNVQKNLPQQAKKQPKYCQNFVRDTKNQMLFSVSLPVLATSFIRYEKRSTGVAFQSIWLYLKHYEFRDRGFIKKCPIMETAVRNYFLPLFSRENGQNLTKKPPFWGSFFVYALRSRRGSAPRSVTIFPISDKVNF